MGLTRFVHIKLRLLSEIRTRKASLRINFGSGHLCVLLCCVLRSGEAIGSGAPFRGVQCGASVPVLLADLRRYTDDAGGTRIPREGIQQFESPAQGQNHGKSRLRTACFHHIWTYSRTCTPMTKMGYSSSTVTKSPALSRMDAREQCSGIRRLAV
jgi:hypothetical protein